jgi:hypothetical protein
LNLNLIKYLAYRYIRKDGTLRFGDFVAIILSLTVAFGKKFHINKLFLKIKYFKKPNLIMYKKIGWLDKKDPTKNGAVKMSTSEVS